MAQPTTTWLVNVSANDGANTGNAAGGLGASDSSWVVVDLVNDVLQFLDIQQMDQDSISGPEYGVIIPALGDIEAPKTFLRDGSTALFRQIPLAGTTAGGQSGGDKRYVFAIFFSGPTASAPYLEAWDSSLHTTAYSTYLGGNGTDTETPANSTIRAIATTGAAPGSATWAGTPLAKTTSRIQLDTAALAAAKNVYWNMRQALPSTFVPLTSEIVLTLRYTYS